MSALRSLSIAKHAAPGGPEHALAVKLGRRWRWAHATEGPFHRGGPIRECWSEGTSSLAAIVSPPRRHVSYFGVRRPTAPYGASSRPRRQRPPGRHSRHQCHSKSPRAPLPPLRLIALVKQQASIAKILGAIGPPLGRRHFHPPERHLVKSSSIGVTELPQYHPLDAPPPPS